MATATEATDRPKPDRRTITIVVNGRPKEVKDKELTFDEVVALAFEPVPTGPNLVITVTYRRGHGNRPEGSMVAGDAVKPKEGMIFNVTVTDKS